MERYDLCGLILESDLAFAARAANDARPADVTIRLAPPREIPDRAAEDWIILAQSGSGRWSVIAKNSTGYFLRCFGICDFAIDRSLAAVSVVPDPSASLEFVAILASGNLLAVLLALRGLLPLHASTVAWGDTGVAFVAASSMGKSTIAALLCLQGAALVTDDVLRVDADLAGVTCALGHTELRLRAQSAHLLDATGRRRDTCDGRVAWQPGTLASRPPSLKAIVVPRVDRAADRCRVRRLSERDALLTLTQFPRILGWHAAEAKTLQFRTLAQVVRSVPVLDAELPWSDDPTDAVAALMDSVSAHGAGAL